MMQNKFLRNIFILGIVFIFIISAIFWGVKSLVSYTSQGFVLSNSVKNIVEENQLSAELRYNLTANAASLDNLNTHLIKEEDDVPKLAAEMESFADSLGISFVINSINIGEPKAKNSKAAPKKEEVKPEGDKTALRANPMYIEITAMGDFGKIMKFITLLENSNYAINFSDYSFKQMGLIESRNSGSGLTPVEIKEENKLQIKKITWVFTAKLMVNTYIK